MKFFFSQPFGVVVDEVPLVNHASDLDDVDNLKMDLSRARGPEKERANASVG